MVKVEFYKHNLNSQYEKYISKVLNSNFLTSGNVCKKTELQIKNFFNVKYSLLTNSWTNGALAVLMALNIKKGDEVIVPAMTFVAVANVVEIVGARPRFVDVDKNTLMFDLKQVLKTINKKTRAIIPVHLYGHMFDVKKLRDEIKKVNKKIYIIEDCAHCFEGSYQNFQPGKWSDCAIFSFYATKNITCGEGGAIITNNKSLYNKVCETRLHGMTRSAIDRFSNKNYQMWNMNRLGVKANLPDILASLLPKQIREVYKKLKLRKNAYSVYEQLLEGSDIRRPIIDKKCNSAHHLYVVHVKPKIRNLVMRYLSKHNIFTTINYTSITQLNFYKKKYLLRDAMFPVSTNWGKGTISLPFYSSIKEKTQKFIIKKLIEAKKKYD
jgi:UDP-4-amino-4-deoxy-L-arabinose-oxoglutarate aminotransferase